MDRGWLGFVPGSLVGSRRGDEVAGRGRRALCERSRTWREMMRLGKAGNIAEGGAGMDERMEVENTKFRVRHVLVESEEMVDAVLEHVKTDKSGGPGAIAALAPSLSTCALSKENGGDLGWHTLADFPFAEIAQRVATLRPNKGWHALTVEDVYEAISPTAVAAVRTFRRAGQNLGRVRVKHAETDWRSYYIETHGCQMNKSDTERMAGALEGLGMRPVADTKSADVVVFNTCSIRDHAEHKLYSQLGPLTQRKWTHPHMVLVVAGCVAQQEAQRLARRVPEVDLVLGPQYANRLSELLMDVAQGNQVVATEPAHISEDLHKPTRVPGVSAWVNVIYGCNERCTYCVVPNTRGVEQSRTPKVIREEMKEIAQQGYREVTLLGQNTDAYGRDLSPKVTFADLLRYVHDVEGIERIRFTTSHPRYFSKDLVRVCAELPKVCESFNVPFQSGDDHILRGMARGYSVARYRQVIEQIRDEIPDASITADLIVGFPGETEEQFENSLKLMEEIQFDHVHTAAYSPRPATPAAIMEMQVAEDVKDHRLQMAIRRNQMDSLARNQRYKNRILEVLVTDTNPRNPEQVNEAYKTPPASTT